MSMKMTIAGLRATITKMKKHQKMVVAGYKAHISANTSHTIAYRKKHR